MSAADENRKVIEGFWTDLYRQDLTAAASRFAPDGTYTDVGTPEDDVAVGPDQIVKRLTLAWSKLAGLHDERRNIVVGDQVVMTEHVETWEWPTGETMPLPVLSVHELLDGKIVRWVDYWDMNTLVAAAPQWWFEHVMQGWKD